MNDPRILEIKHTPGDWHQYEIKLGFNHGWHYILKSLAQVSSDLLQIDELIVVDVHGQAKDKDARGKDGVFGKTPRRAYFERKALLPKRHERYAANGAHIEEGMGKGPEGKAFCDAVGQRSKQMRLRKTPEQQPPSRPMRSFSMRPVECTLAEQSLAGAADIQNIRDDRSGHGRNKLRKGHCQRKSPHKRHALMRQPFHAGGAAQTTGLCVSHVPEAIMVAVSSRQKNDAVQKRSILLTRKNAI